jgi:uncharacterized Fe-S radical SAM superfamily protein PflX
VDERGVARRGLLCGIWSCRVVLPARLRSPASWRRRCPDTYINVMDQYRPAHEAARLGSARCMAARVAAGRECSAISRPPTSAEYRSAVQQALDAGLWRLDGGKRPSAADPRG